MPHTPLPPSAQFHHPPVRHSCWNGDLGMVETLIAAGADAGSLDEEHNNTAFGWAQVSRQITNNPRWEEVADYLAALT